MRFSKLIAGSDAHKSSRRNLSCIAYCHPRCGYPATSATLTGCLYNHMFPDIHEAVQLKHGGRSLLIGKYQALQMMQRKKCRGRLTVQVFSVVPRHILLFIPHYLVFGSSQRSPLDHSSGKTFSPVIERRNWVGSLWLGVPHLQKPLSYNPPSKSDQTFSLQMLNCLLQIDVTSGSELERGFILALSIRSDENLEHSMIPLHFAKMVPEGCVVTRMAG